MLLVVTVSLSLADGAESDARTLEISVSDVNVSSGEDFSINFDIINNPGTWSIRIVVLFDSRISVTGVDDGSILDLTPGKIRPYSYVIYGEDSGLSDTKETGRLATIHFKVAKGASDGVFNLVFESEAINSYGISVPVSVRGGQISVSHVHTFDVGTVTVEPTTTSEGVRTYACTSCGFTKTESIPKTSHEHSWSDAVTVTPPSCDKAGVKESTCTTCEEKRVESIPMTDHVWGDPEIVKAPTVDSEGYQKYVCSVCGTVKGEVIPAIDVPDPEPEYPDSNYVALYVVIGAVAFALAIGVALLLKRFRS